MLESGTPPHGRAAARIQRLNEKETMHGHDLISLIPLLRSASSPLLSECSEALGVLDDWIRDCNSGRWTWLVKKASPKQAEDRQKGLQDCLQKLRSVKEEFEITERIKLIRPFEKFFDKKTGRPLKSMTVATIEGSEFSARYVPQFFIASPSNVLVDLSSSVSFSWTR